MLCCCCLSSCLLMRFAELHQSMQLGRLTLVTLANRVHGICHVVAFAAYCRLHCEIDQGSKHSNALTPVHSVCETRRPRTSSGCNWQCGQSLYGKCCHDVITELWKGSVQVRISLQQ